jgi:methionyl-tRNA synthetase
LPTPETVFVHGFLTINGQKISKSLGNVIDPAVQVERYGADAVRYYLLRAVSPFEDGDFAEERFRDVYNADLANNLGNLVRRIETLGEKAGYAPTTAGLRPAPPSYQEAMQGFRFNDALASLWLVCDELNGRIESVKPWQLQKADKQGELHAFLDEMVSSLRCIAQWLAPFMPETARKLSEAFRGQALKKSDPLFPRLI